MVWLGLSAKLKTSLFERPLDGATHSGKLVDLVEEDSPELVFYRSNAMKCPPLESGKLRYPTRQELETCWPNTVAELEILKPRCLLVLGTIVAKHVERMTGVMLEKPTDTYRYKFSKWPEMNICVMWIHHPSFIQTYRRKAVSRFREGLVTRLASLKP